MRNGKNAVPHVLWSVLLFIIQTDQCMSVSLSEWVHIWERECEKIERNYQLSEFSSAYFFSQCISVHFVCTVVTAIEVCRR